MGDEEGAFCMKMLALCCCLNMVFWVALGMAGYAASGLWAAGIGAVAMVLLFLVVSIPMLDKRQLANKPEYADYKRQVPALIPVIGWH